MVLNPRSGKKLSIADLTHPRYSLRYREWYKWRLTYHSGPQFIQQYLKTFSKRESPEDFAIRKDMTYVPAFAKACVDEVKNSIYQRMTDISRDGGSDAYKRACGGLDHGVDLLGATMNSYIGQKVLPELLVMGRVGVYVDMPPIPGTTMVDIADKRPYIYLYETEDIRSWTYDDRNSPNEFGSLLLRDYIYEYDPETGLPKGQGVRFRHYWIEDGSVFVQFYDKEGQFINQEGNIDEDTGPIRLNISRIPFVILELSDSLMTDIANYQISMLNLASSNLTYALKANYPFYVEQYEPKADQSQFLRVGGPQQGIGTGTAASAQSAQTAEIRTGISAGRRYPVGTERPGFIHPSSEPLKASMELLDAMKAEIRLLLNLAISNLLPRATSAEAKGFDERSLEAGLSSIGLELEHAERMIASYWSMYENPKKPEPASIKYPEKYNLKSDAERIKEASDTGKLIAAVPSRTYQRELSKQLARIMLGARVSEETLRKIDREIDDSVGINSDPQAIEGDVTLGICDLKTAAKLRGYPEEAVDKAANDHAARLARIQAAQTPPAGDPKNSDPAARGVKDLSADPKAGSKERADQRDTTQNDNTQDPTRGQGKGDRADKGTGTSDNAKNR